MPMSQQLFSLQSLKGLLYYPTCMAKLRVSTWSEVGGMHELPQMTHLEVGKSGRRSAVITAVITLYNL